MIVQLATVNVDHWITAQTSVLVYILTVMRIFNVCVTGKVCSLSCSYRYQYAVFITGFLCGKCQHDKGVSVLLNNCKSCGAENLLLLLALGRTLLIM